MVLLETLLLSWVLSLCIFESPCLFTKVDGCRLLFLQKKLFNMSDEENDDMQLEKLLKAMKGKSANQEKRKVAAKKKEYKRKLSAIQQSAIRDIALEKASKLSQVQSMFERLRREVLEVGGRALEFA